MGVGGPLKRRIVYVFKKTVWYVLKKDGLVVLKKTDLAACEELSYDSIGVVTTVGSTVRHVIL